MRRKWSGQRGAERRQRAAGRLELTNSSTAALSSKWPTLRLVLAEIRPRIAGISRAAIGAALVGGERL